MVRDLCPRVLLLGGGGYNPWTVARAWTGAWATLAGYPIPDTLPPEARAVLRAITWQRGRAPYAPEPYLTDTLADAPRPGPVRPEVVARTARLAARLSTLA
ncbi:MAG: acetoin utilization protein AcuC, partial [Shimia sp.]